MLLRDLPGGEHQPDDTGGLEAGDQVFGTVRGLEASFLGEALRDIRIAIERDDLDATLAQPPGHVGPHAPQTDQSQFHGHRLPELCLQDTDLNMNREWLLRGWSFPRGQCAFNAPV